MSNILLISAPGAGKGVTSEYLKEKYNMVHMSIGNLLREESEKNTSLKEKLANGEFIENNIVYSLFSKFLEDNKGSSFIFEGFPRLMEQVKPFLDILSEHDIILDKIIFIDIDKDIALKRVTGRLMCKNCNEIYNKYVDNLENNKCKVCGGSLYTRDDDKIETYENRYKLFKEKTMPVVEYLSDKYDIYTVSNNGTFDEMKSQIDNIMGNWESVKMAKNDVIEVDGKVIDVLPGGKFKVELANGHIVEAHVSGKIRMNNIRILPGDTVVLELSPADITHGRITWNKR